MKFISRITDSMDSEKIVEELLDGADGVYDLGVLFVAPFHPYDPDEISRQIRKRVQVRHMLACTCAGIVGPDREVENKPSASLFLGRMPDVEIMPFYLDQAKLDELTKPEDWYDFLNVFPNEKPSFLVLPDPFQLDTNQFLFGVNRAYPQCSIIGGLASGGTQANDNVLILDDHAYDEGLIGLALTGNVAVETVVSQGCRPFGQTFIITKAEENVIHELAGRPFLKVLEEELQKATARERLLAQEAIFIGLAMNEYAHQYKRGDFLIRGVMAIDEKSGAGLVADYVQPGQTIQFHVRDAHAADEDLHALLGFHKNKITDKNPQGALVFSCNGRGKGLFGENDHDIKIIQQHLGPIPAAGFFCAGEIGPVGGKNFLHGFTSSMALFYSPRASS